MDSDVTPVILIHDSFVNGNAFSEFTRLLSVATILM